MGYVSRSTRARRLRELILEAVDRTPRDSVLALSGGVDSTTLLFASLALGRAPRCVTFRVGEYDSPDVRAARSIATAFGVSLDLVSIPRDRDALVRDISRVLCITGSPRKVHVQCCHPWLYVAPHVFLMASESVAGPPGALLVGTTADDLWGNSRTVEQGVRDFGEHEGRMIRTADWEYTGPSVVTLMRDVAAHYGVTMVDVYRDEALARYVLDLDWAVINKPRMKALVVEAFREYWSRGAWYRPGDNFQVVSGLREFHGTLLADPIANPDGAKAIVAIYNRMWAQLHAAGLAPAKPADEADVRLEPCTRPREQLIERPWLGQDLTIETDLGSYSRYETLDRRHAYACVRDGAGKVEWFHIFPATS